MDVAGGNVNAGQAITVHSDPGTDIDAMINLPDHP
jgi:hypothetical protein